MSTFPTIAGGEIDRSSPLTGANRTKPASNSVMEKFRERDDYLHELYRREATPGYASNTLRFSIGSGTAGAELNSTAGFPAAGDIQIDSEIIGYTTNVAGTQLGGFTRGKYGTVAAAHSAGAAVTQYNLPMTGRIVNGAFPVYVIGSITNDGVLVSQLRQSTGAVTLVTPITNDDGIYPTSATFTPVLLKSNYSAADGIPVWAGGFYIINGPVPAALTLEPEFFITPGTDGTPSLFFRVSYSGASWAGTPYEAWAAWTAHLWVEA